MGNILLHVNLECGREGLDLNSKNPLCLAYAPLLGKGRSHFSHTLCFINFDDDLNSLPTNLRWFGVFLHTTGNRILFFPGLVGPIDWVETSVSSTSSRYSLQLDHITAEPIRQRWHFTGTNSAIHLAGGRMPKHHGSESYFWFGISMSNDQSLFPVYKHTLISHPAPEADLIRRKKELDRLQSMAKFARVNCDTQSHLLQAETFLHVGVLLTKKDNPVYRDEEWLVPFNSPYVSPPLPHVLPQSRLRYHRIPLSDEWDISIGTTVLPGKLTVAAAFTGAGTL